MRHWLTSSFTAVAIQRVRHVHPGGAGRRAGAAPAAEGRRQQAFPRHRRRQAVLLAGRHRVGAVSPPESRGRREVSEEPRRARFTVVQAVVLAELDGLNDAERLRRASAHRQRPGAPERSVLRARRLDRRARQRARHLRRHAADVGRQVEPAARRRPGDLHPRERRSVRRVARRRYKDAGIIWILGGDRQVENSTHIDITRAMARGLRQGDGGAHLITFHPPAATARRPGSTTTTGSTSTCGRTATSPSSPAATT